SQSCTTSEGSYWIELINCCLTIGLIIPSLFFVLLSPSRSEIQLKEFCCEQPQTYKKKKEVVNQTKIFVLLLIISKIILSFCKMTTGASLPKTGEDWIHEDKPDKLLDWVKNQKEPKACLQRLFLHSLRQGRWNCATKILDYDGSVLQARDGMRQNILFYWADGMQQNKNMKEAIKWLNEHVALESIKRMISERNEEGSTIFHAVAVTGQHELLQWILDTCPELNVNQVNNYDYTALHKAARNGQKGAIKWLLDHQADISRITVNGDRPEHEALKREKIGVICYLQPSIHWPANLDATYQILLQARYDHAQAIRLSFPKMKSSEKEVIEYHSNQFAKCHPEYKALVIESMRTVHQLAIACLLALSDVTLSYIFWTDEIERKRTLYRLAMGYATAACSMAAKHFNLPNALLWQKQSSSQQIRILAQVLPSSTPISYELYHCWNSRLVQLRRRCVTNTSNSPPSPPSSSPLRITKQMTEGLCGILKMLWEFVLDRLPQPPCEYALLALGSLGREEATPYSDIECGCLIATDSPDIRKYFTNASAIFELVLIGLGETPEELLGLFNNNCNEQPQIIRTGLHADYFYMPHRSSDLLLHTPTNLAGIQTSRNWELLDRQILLSYRKIVGSDDLFATYQSCLEQLLNKNLGGWLKANRLREKISLEIVDQIIESLNPMSQVAQGVETDQIGVCVKKQLYRLSQQMILALSLYYGLGIGHIVDQVNELARRRRAFCDKTLTLLHDLICRALQWRITTQMHYQAAHEWLYQPYTQVPLSEVQPYRLTAEEQTQLKQVYAILWSLYQSAKRWSEEGNPSFLKRTQIHQIDSLGQMLVHAQFNEMDDAINCYQARFCLTLEVQAQNRRYILTAGNMNQWNIWNQSLVRDWAAKCVHARLSLELLEVCRDLLRVTEERNTFVTKLEMHNINLSHVTDHSQSRSNWLHNCTQEIQTSNADWNTRIEQWQNQRDSHDKDADETIVECYRKEQRQGTLQSTTPYFQCQLFALLRPAFEQVRTQRESLLKKCEKELSIEVENKNIPKYLPIIGWHCCSCCISANSNAAPKKADEGTRDFLSNVLTALHRMPDKCGETTLWKEEKKKWKETLQKLVEDRAPRANEPTFNSPLIGGCKPLQASVAAQLLDENGKFKQNRISGGQRDVIPIALDTNTPPIIYAKAWPEMPGMSYLMEQCHHRIIGHGTYHSELVCLRYADGDSIPVLCSEAVHGPTLQEVIENESERLNKLDHQYYTELLFVALLTNPEDGLPTNYIVKCIDNKKDTLVSIDHDHALFPDWLPDKNTKQLQLQIKTILFCLDCMHQQINPIARERFLTLDSRQMMESIFRDTQSQNEMYSKMFPTEIIHRWHHNDASNSCTIPIPLKKGDAVAMYSRWSKLRTLLKLHPDVTGLQCLIQLHPKAGIAYSDALQKYKDPIERLAQLGRYQLNKFGVMASNTRALRTLTRAKISTHINDILPETGYWDLEDLTPAKALAELDQLSYQCQQLEKICDEVASGNFKAFERLLSLEDQSAILRGDPERGFAPFHWNKLSDEQQLTLAHIVQLHPFEELSLRGFNFNIWSVEKMELAAKMTHFFSGMMNLRWLDLSDTMMDDSDLNAITKQCQTLQTLIARRCSRLQGKSFWMCFSLHELIVDESGIRTLTGFQAPKMVRFEGNHCSKLTNVEISIAMPCLRQWKMINATYLSKLKLKAPVLESLQLGGCSSIVSISTGSSMLSVLDIQGCAMLNSVGLTDLVVLLLPKGQSQLKQVIFADTTFPTIIRCCPQALFLRYHPPQVDLFTRLEHQFEHTQVSNQTHVQEYKDKLLHFLERFDTQVATIFEKVEPENIVQCLMQINGIDKDHTQVLLNQLKVALEDKDTTIFIKAVRAIGQVKPTAVTNEALKRLALVLKDSNEDIRMEAVKALGALGPSAISELALDQLQVMLQDESKHICALAAKTLGLMGPAAATQKSVVDTLINALKDEDWDVRSGAAKALKSTGQAGTKSVSDALLTAMKDKDWRARRNAIEVLGLLGREADVEPVLKELAIALKDKENSVRQEAVKVLGNFGVTADTESVLKELTAVILNDEDWSLRKQAVETLCLIQSTKAIEYVNNNLAVALSNANRKVRKNAAITLSFLGSAAITEQVLHQLTAALKDKQVSVRKQVVKTLHSFGPAAATEHVVSQLTNVLHDQNNEASSISCIKGSGIIWSGRSYGVYVECTDFRFESEDWSACRDVAEILTAMGTAAATEHVLNELVTALKDENWSIRRNAAEIFGSMGPTAATEHVLGQLAIALKDENKEVRSKAAEALKLMNQNIVVATENGVITSNAENDLGQESLDSLHGRKSEIRDITTISDIWKCPEIVILENFARNSRGNIQDMHEEKKVEFEQLLPAEEKEYEEKKQDMQIIQEKATLKEYYETVVLILHSVCTIRDDSISTAGLPEFDITGSITETIYKRTQRSKNNVLTTFFANPKIIETLARDLTIAQKYNLLSLPNLLLRRMETSKNAVDNNKIVVTGSDCNTVIRRKATYDCDKLLLAIENGNVKGDADRNIESLIKIVLNDITQ
ncbi:HEAT repeat-containing PBS lyase, partial [Reticulomyxa filosa]